MWQDWAIVGVQITFAASLIPTVLHPTQKPTMITAVMTTACVTVLGLVFASLHLWLAAGMCGVNTALWLTLAIQRYRLNRNL